MDKEPEYTSGNYSSFNEEPTETESESNMEEFIENNNNGNKTEIMPKKRTNQEGKKQRRTNKGGKKRSLTGNKRSLTGKKQRRTSKKRSHNNR